MTTLLGELDRNKWSYLKAPYKKFLVSHHFFLKKWGGEEYFIFIFRQMPFWIRTYHNSHIGPHHPVRISIWHGFHCGTDGKQFAYCFTLSWKWKLKNATSISLGEYVYTKVKSIQNYSPFDDNRVGE